jgi:hypothetical protein
VYSGRYSVGKRICARAHTHTHTACFTYTKTHTHKCIHIVQEVASAESGGVDLALAGSRGRYDSLCIHTAPCLCIRKEHAHQVQGGECEAGSAHGVGGIACVRERVCARACAIVSAFPSLSLSSLPWPPLPARALQGLPHGRRPCREE